MAWADIPTGYQNEILDLVNQWNQISGYQHVNRVSVANTGFMFQLAQQGITSLSELGQYLWNQRIGDPNHPWEAFGLSKDTYTSKLQDLASSFQTMTGYSPDLSYAVNAQNPPAGGYFWTLWDAMRRGLTGSALTTELMQNQNALQSFGWLRFGLNYTQFQQQKVQMAQTFGRTLTDQEGVQQLQYLHAAQGADVQARQQQTLTQVEKQAAQVGVAGAQIR